MWTLIKENMTEKNIYAITRIGKINIATNKQLMIITEYDKNTDITVQFEDGTTVNHKTYDHFRIGRIGNPNNPTERYQNKFKKQAESRTGTTVTAKNGMKMTIIAYRRSDDIDVQFEDDTIVKHKQYKHFLKGKIGNPNISVEEVITDHKKNERIGESWFHNASGMKMTIVAYRRNDDVDIKFEDGTILCHQKYWAVKNDKIRHPKYTPEQFAANRHIGQQIITKNNVLAVVTSYENCENLTVIFENGIKMKTINVDNIKRRKTIPEYIDDIHLNELAFFYDGEYYYICSSSKWNNNRKILSINQIYEIARNEMK